MATRARLKFRLDRAGSSFYAQKSIEARAYLQRQEPPCPIPSFR
jgi:hypothetical protein